MKRIKSLYASSVVRCGQELSPSVYYTIPDMEVALWSSSDDVLADIANGKLVINNGDQDIAGAAEQISFLKGLENDPLTIDGRRIYQVSPRKIGTYAYYTGSGDCGEDPLNIGGDDDDDFSCHHIVGEPTTQYKYLEFNSVLNETYLFSGFLQWLGAKNDNITIEVVPSVTAYAAGTNTYFNLYGGYLIVPAAGNGSVAVDPSSIKLVQCVKNEFGTRSPGYWNATFNSSTKLFENLQPAPLGNGEFNIFGAEVTLSRFVNRFQVLGEGNFTLPSSDISQIPHGARLKATTRTSGDDHDWWWSANIVVFRKKTC